MKITNIFAVGWHKTAIQLLSFLGTNVGICFIFSFHASTLAATPAIGNDYRAWIVEMKTRKRGAFSRIRWFCNDGAILPPAPYACSDHGGGRQHGEWSDKAKTIRENGFLIANFLADFEPDAIVKDDTDHNHLVSIILEQFLIANDDGWILRKSRFYRGSIQWERELKSARNILLAMCRSKEWYQDRFLLFRESTRWLSHGKVNSDIDDVRAMATDMYKKSADFNWLRSKIHGRPDSLDATRVRDYAKKLPEEHELQEPLERLAELIEKIYSPDDLNKVLEDLSQRLASKQIKTVLARLSSSLTTTQSNPQQRLAALADGLESIRSGIGKLPRINNRLALLDVSLRLEKAFFITATELLQDMATTSRAERLQWLRHTHAALYGVGLLSQRQKAQLDKSLSTFDNGFVNLWEYKRELEYLARISQWTERNLQFWFGDIAQRWVAIEPLIKRFFDDRLRASPTLFYAGVLDSLVKDVHRLTGVDQRFFGQSVGAGLRGLNAGISRGRLHVVDQINEDTKFSRDGIYLVSSTVAELPPVAGILTRGEGSSLSHVQLLARNLGIPNVVVAERLVADIRAQAGQNIVLAVSAGGVVHLEKDNADWDAVLGKSGQPELFLIEPDLDKLDLSVVQPLLLTALRASDSGRIAGPKAANLAELKYHFPDAVSKAVVIPFGVFRNLLAQPYAHTGMSVFAWMQAQYAQIKALENEPEKADALAKTFLAALRQWILQADHGGEFRLKLQQIMTEVFGNDGSYGVFVRSDTNVEDLPGFTGAGLNKTIPNVVGFANILQAISKVWASPFSDRAYAWRQSHMAMPQHVYASVLIQQSVNVDKSGVLVTQALTDGNRDWLSIAANEGVGGAVEGQAAEEIMVHRTTAETILLAQATNPWRRLLRAEGGVDKTKAKGADSVLSQAEIKSLMALTKEQELRFPMPTTSSGKQGVADIEFGFIDNKLMLFQIRPFLKSKRASRYQFLQVLDQAIDRSKQRSVLLDGIPTQQ